MNEKFCKLLKDGLEDEAKAGKFYDELIKEMKVCVAIEFLEAAAGDDFIKIREKQITIEMLERIKKSEESHHRNLKNIENYFC